MAEKFKLGIPGEKETNTRIYAGTVNDRKRKWTEWTAKDRGHQITAPKPKKGKPAMSLIVGIDFGTTYTGVSIVPSTCRPSKTRVITEWPGSEDSLEKVPSIIAYEEDNKALFTGKKWGYEVTRNMKAYSWFKLNVADNDAFEEHDDPLLRQSAGQGLMKLPDGKTADDVCKDYLECLYKHILNKLKEDWGETVEETSLKFVLTVPAGWNDKTKSRILTAAEDAGFGTRVEDSIRMTDEPEAAALNSFECGSGKLLAFELFAMHSNLMVVDMGGGTIDLITYRVIGWTPFKVEEACVGTGAKCGSTTIDRQLHALMEKKYGSAFKEKADSLGIGSKFMRSFEAIKRRFDGKREENFTLPLLMDHPDTDDYKQGLQRVTITRAELKTMFEEVLANTFALVSDQLSKAKQENGDDSKTIVLCGGLAQSPYIIRKFDEFCLKELKGGTKIFVPQKPWSAIARGAALRALKPRSTIESRKCRRSYGVSAHREFIDGQDPEELALHCPVSGKRLDGVMKWHIKKGEKIEQQKKNWIDGFIVLNGKNGNNAGFSGSLDVYYCNLDYPPEMVSSEGVRKLGELKVDFSNMSMGWKLKAEINSRARNGEPWDQKVRIGQIVHAERGVVEFVAAARNNKIVGQKTFEYEGQDSQKMKTEEEY